MINNFPHFIQLDAMDCGPTCLRIVAKYYGHSFYFQTLREKSFITREGVSMLGICDAADGSFTLFNAVYICWAIGSIGLLKLGVYKI